MTDEVETVETAPQAPKPRRKTPVRKTPPPPRRKRVADAIAGGANGEARERTAAGSASDPIAALIRQNEALMARLERLESGGIRHVENEPPTRTEIVLTDAMSDFTRGLAERTHEVPEDYGGDREPNYNVPERWFLKPPSKNKPSDPPSYVQLQGDAKSRAYYQDKGFYLLTPDEERQFLQVERPRLFQEQRTKAALITAMRNLVKREATLSGYIDDWEWDDALSGMTTDRLEEEWHALCRQTANPDRRLPRAERVREQRDADAERLLAGVETTPSRTARETFENSLPDILKGAEGGTASRRSRMIEVGPQNARQFS